MTTVATAVLLIYAALMLAGGFIGYRLAGSTASITAGSASALVLFAAFLLSRYRPPLGFVSGAAVALVLSIVFARRLLKTGKFMPAGMMLVSSIVTLVILAVTASRL